MSPARLRNWAAWGARHGPDWFVLLAPPIIGFVAFCLATRARRAVLANLRRICGERELVFELRDAVATFVHFARNLTEALCPERFFERQRLVVDDPHHEEHADAPDGLVLATAHVGPWDNAAMTLSRLSERPVMMLLAEEQSEDAAGIQDKVRSSERIEVVRLGSSPMAALPIAGHLARGGIVVAQMDRPFGARPPVQGLLFGQPFPVSPGLVRLAAAARCRLLPVFMARLPGGGRLVRIGRAIRVQSRPQSDDVIFVVNQYLAQLEEHLRLFPTQWFHFVSETDTPTGA